MTTRVVARVTAAPICRLREARLQQAGGWRSPATPEVYIRREVCRPRAGRAAAPMRFGSLQAAVMQQ